MLLPSCRCSEQFTVISVYSDSTHDVAALSLPLHDTDCNVVSYDTVNVSHAVDTTAAVADYIV